MGPARAISGMRSKIHRGLGFVGVAAVTALVSACAPNLRPPPPVEKPTSAHTETIDDVVVDSGLIPVPAHFVLKLGALAVGDGTPIVFSKGDVETSRIAHYLADLVTRTKGPLLVPQAGDVASPPARAIVLRRLADKNATGAEG